MLCIKTPNGYRYFCLNECELCKTKLWKEQGVITMSPTWWKLNNYNSITLGSACNRCYLAIKEGEKSSRENVELGNINLVQATWNKQLPLSLIELAREAVGNPALETTIRILTNQVYQESP